MQRLPDRLSAATQMEDIFERNPAWKRASRRLSTGANDHINVRSTTGPRSTVDVDVRNCWEGGRADAVTALNAHPAYSVSVKTFIDAAAELALACISFEIDQFSFRISLQKDPNFVINFVYI